MSQCAQTDPAALLDYLDRFVDVSADLAREEKLRQDLLDLQTKIEEVTRKVEQIPQYERDLNLAQSQIQALEKANAKDIIALQRNVELERQVRQTILACSQAISRGATHQEVKRNLTTLKAAADPTTLIVGGSEFGVIATQAGTFEKAISAAEASVHAAAGSLWSVVTTQLAAWKGKEQVVVKQIDDKKRELEAQGIRVDMAYIQKLAADEARLKQDVANLNTWKPHLDGLWKERRDDLKERWAVRSRIAMKRSAFGAKASKAMRAALADLSVSLKFDENGYAPEANDIIVETMGWRTLQVPRAGILTEKLTLPKLLDVLGKQDALTLEKLTTNERARVLRKRMPQRSLRGCRLTRCDFGWSARRYSIDHG